MKTTVLMISAAAGLLLMAGPAFAGQCSMEIATLQKVLGSTDAGMGPTANSLTGAAIPGTTAEVPTTPATGAMNDAATGKATSPQDVQSQNTGEPTAADAASAAQMNTAAGAAEATALLQKASQLDQAGNETACLDEIAKARQALGVQ